MWLRRGEGIRDVCCAEKSEERPVAKDLKLRAKSESQRDGFRALATA